MEHVNAEILRAIADGKKVQYRDAVTDPWKDFDVKSIEACWNLLAPGKFWWRIAPKTIMFGEHEVPEPVRESPQTGEEYWIVNPFTGPLDYIWRSDSEDHHALNCGFVHLAKEAAEKHYEAIKSLLAK